MPSQTLLDRKSAIFLDFRRFSMGNNLFFRLGRCSSIKHEAASTQLYEMWLESLGGNKILSIESISSHWDMVCMPQAAWFIVLLDPMPPPFAIGLSGPSRAGKTTLAAGLCRRFCGAGAEREPRKGRLDRVAPPHATHSTNPHHRRKNAVIMDA